MGGVATVQRDCVALNINLQPHVVLLLMKFFFHLKEKKEKKKKSTKTKMVTHGKEIKKERKCLLL